MFSKVNIHRWCSRIVSTSNCIGKGVDIVIKGPYGKCQWMYWRLCEMMVHVGIDKCLREPQSLVLVTLLYQDLLLEAADEELIKIMDHGLDFAKMKDWISNNFQKHELCFDNLVDLRKTLEGHKLKTICRLTRKGLNPSPAIITSFLKLIREQQQECQVCMFFHFGPTKSVLQALKKLTCPTNRQALNHPEQLFHINQLPCGIRLDVQFLQHYLKKHKPAMKKAIQLLNACCSQSFQHVIRFLMSGLSWSNYVKNPQWNAVKFVCILCVTL